MHELWTISTMNMMCTRLQNHTNMTDIGELGIQTFIIVIVVLLVLLLLSGVFAPTCVHPCFLDKWFVQIFNLTSTMSPWFIEHLDIVT